MTDTPKCEPPPEWREAMNRYNALSPADRALTDDEQRRSWIRGETGRDPGPHPLAAEVQSLRTECGGQRIAIDEMTAEITRLPARVAELVEALHDMRAGWRYIRREHGDLYGVGWDRCEHSATAAIERALSDARAAMERKP